MYFDICVVYAFFHNSRFVRNIWAQKRSSPPFFLYDLKHDFLLRVNRISNVFDFHEWIEKAEGGYYYIRG